MKKDENELFSSSVAGGTNDNTGLAIFWALAVAVGGAFVLFLTGVTGGAVMAVPAVFAFLTYTVIKKDNSDMTE